MDTFYKTNVLCISNTNAMRNKKRQGNTSRFYKTDSMGC